MWASTRDFLFGWVYQYGRKEELRARRHRFTGAVQFVIWEKGPHRAEDAWITSHPTHWKFFIPDTK